MEAFGGNPGQKRVNLPSPADAEVVELTVKLLAARCGAAFGRGFRLKAIGQRLYVQVSGRKIPLHLHFEADPITVQMRATQLRDFLRERKDAFDSEAWRDACAVERVRRGKDGPARPARLSLDEVVERWRRLKAAEGISEDSFERHYLVHLRRLNPRRPLSEESLLSAIEQTAPRSPTRRRLVPFLRRLCSLCGAEWNAALLDPLQGSGRPVEHRQQAFFDDEEIEAMLRPGAPLSAAWRRVVTLLAVYGLRPWEAWVAEPCRERPYCVWVPTGKTNRHGTTRPRQVPPFHPEWAERFGVETLWDVPLPPLASPSRAGARVNQYLRRLGVIGGEGQTSYGFRHAYARRLHSPRHRVTDAHASLFMGHTVAAHHKAYRSWLGGEDPIAIYFNSPDSVAEPA